MTEEKFVFSSNSRPLKVEEVALIVGVSVQTINNWYRWKKLNPDNELAKSLPPFLQDGDRQTRYWNQSDIFEIVNFRNQIPHGRNGILGDVTQITSRKKREEKNDGEKNS